MPLLQHSGRGPWLSEVQVVDRVGPPLAPPRERRDAQPAGQEVGRQQRGAVPLVAELRSGPPVLPPQPALFGGVDWKLSGARGDMEAGEQGLEFDYSALKNDWSTKKINALKKM